MTNKIGGIFNHADKVQMASMQQRLQRSHVLNSNIANAETPGYRAIGYDFEDQLQSFVEANQTKKVRVSDPKHLRNTFTQADGTMRPDVFVRPTESVPEDGNTVDVDVEMANLSKNTILYRTAVETINRKVGMLRYAINGGN